MRGSFCFGLNCLSTNFEVYTVPKLVDQDNMMDPQKISMILPTTQGCKATGMLRFLLASCQGGDGKEAPVHDERITAQDSSSDVLEPTEKVKATKKLYRLNNRARWCKCIVDIKLHIFR
jgi:hypothetical protein